MQTANDETLILLHTNPPQKTPHVYLKWPRSYSISLFNSLERGNVITCPWTPSSRNTSWLLNAEVEYLLLYLKGSRGGSEREGKRSSIMYAPPQHQNLLTAELSTHTAAARPNQGRVPSGQRRVTGLQSRGIDQALEFSINLPSDMLPV